MEIVSKQLWTVLCGPRHSEHCPLHWETAVHRRAVIWHLRRPVQPFLQPHCKSSLQASDASDRIVHPPPGFLFQPHSLGDGSSGAEVIHHLGPTATSLVGALLVCWMSAACVGGRPSVALPFLLNSLVHALPCAGASLFSVFSHILHTCWQCVVVSLHDVSVILCFVAVLLLFSAVLDVKQLFSLSWSRLTFLLVRVIANCFARLQLSTDN